MKCLRKALYKGHKGQAEYELPYHWLISPESMGGKAWAFEYLAYIEACQEIVNGLETPSVLDVGCGDGRFLHGLKAGLKDGCDLDARAVKWANASADCYTVMWNQDARDLGLSRHVVTAIEVLEHIPDGGQREFWQALRDRSDRWILTCVPSAAIPVTPKHHRHYTLHSLFEEQVASGAKLQAKEVFFIWSPPAWFELICLALANPVWKLDIPWLNRRLYKISRKWTKGNPWDSRHLVVLWEKR